MSEELKAQLIDAHQAVYAGVLDAVDGLDERAWSTPTGCPGWDVHDQLAHVIGVERLMLGDPPDDVALPDELPHVRNDFGRGIEVAVHARRGRLPAELVSEARACFDRRLEALTDLDPAALRDPLDGPGGMRMKGSQMLRTRVFDMTCHEQDIRRALGRLDGLAGLHVAIATEQVLRAWAKLLPERLGTDAVLGVEVAGAAPVALTLADGGFHRDPPLPAAAVTLHLDAAALLAVGTGRSDAPTIDALGVDGDRELAGRWLAVASVTP